MGDIHTRRITKGGEGPKALDSIDVSGADGNHVDTFSSADESLVELINDDHNFYISGSAAAVAGEP